jgi:hypothetical protein
MDDVPPHLMRPEGIGLSGHSSSQCEELLICESKKKTLNCDETTQEFTRNDEFKNTLRI